MFRPREGVETTPNARWRSWSKYERSDAERQQPIRRVETTPYFEDRGRDDFREGDFHQRLGKSTFNRRHETISPEPSHHRLLHTSRESSPRSANRTNGGSSNAKQAKDFNSWPEDEPEESVEQKSIPNESKLRQSISVLNQRPRLRLTPQPAAFGNAERSNQKVLSPVRLMNRGSSEPDYLEKPNNFPTSKRGPVIMTKLLEEPTNLSNSSSRRSSTLSGLTSDRRETKTQPNWSLDFDYPEEDQARKKEQEGRQRRRRQEKDDQVFDRLLTYSHGDHEIRRQPNEEGHIDRNREEDSRTTDYLINKLNNVFGQNKTPTDSVPRDEWQRLQAENGQLRTLLRESNERQARLEERVDRLRKRMDLLGLKYEKEIIELKRKLGENTPKKYFTSLNAI